MARNENAMWIAIDPLITGNVAGHPQTMITTLFERGIIAEAWATNESLHPPVKKVFQGVWPLRNFSAKSSSLWGRPAYRLKWFSKLFQSNINLFLQLHKYRFDKRNWIFLNAKIDFILGYLFVSYFRANHKHAFWFFDAPVRSFKIAGLLIKVLRLRNVYFYAETPTQAEEFRVFLGHEVSFAVFPVYTKPQYPRVQERLTIGILGPARREKGFDLLPEILSKVADLTAGGCLHFLLQPPWSTDVELRSTLALLETDGAVTLLSPRLDKNEYEFALNSSDAVLVPYRARNYARRSSWVVMEGIASGKVILITRGIPACELVERFGVGLFFEDGNEQEIADCIRRLTRERDLLAQAQAKAVAFSKLAFWTPPAGPHQRLS